MTLKVLNGENPLAAAISLAARGFAVFPMRRNRLCDDGEYRWPNTGDPNHPRHMATNDPEQIQRWAEMGAFAGDVWLGVRPRFSGLVVVDIDRHPDGDDGHATWARWLERYTAEGAPWQTTPRDGMHIFFRARSPGRMRTHLGGVDLLGAGSCTVWGSGYVWQSDLRAIPEVPRWLDAVIRDRQAAVRLGLIPEPPSRRRRPKRR